MIKLNGIELPEFVKVNKIEFSILPPIENRMLDIRGRKSPYFIDQQLGKRKISVSITLIAEKINGVMSKARELAAWLYNDKPVKLEIADDPGKYYMVVIDGETQLSEIANVGQGTLDFICTEPFAFGSEQLYHFTTAGEEPTGVVNTGNAEVYPRIDITVNQDITDISVVGSEGFVSFGNPYNVETTIIDPNPLILWDKMGSITDGWTSGISIDGEITGTFKTNGVAFLADTWGTGAAWHGSALVKTLPQQLQDFEVEMSFDFHTDSITQVARVEFYLFDANNNNIGRIHFSDATNGADKQNFMARAGALDGGYQFVEERDRTVWNNFNGKMTLSRIGNKWTAFIGKYDPKTRTYNSRFTKVWTDVNKKVMNKLAKVQVHLGGYGTHKAPTNLSINDLRVYNRLTLTPSNTPIIAKAGDVLTIDNEKAEVFKNGIPFFEGIQPESTFIKLNPGMNGITVTASGSEVDVSYIERWL